MMASYSNITFTCIWAGVALIMDSSREGTMWPRQGQGRFTLNATHEPKGRNAEVRLVHCDLIPASLGETVLSQGRSCDLKHLRTG